jgi:molecular chaperone HtpG
MPEPRTCEFKAEVRQLLDLVIHSLYSKKEIFLRELISNAADAIDRAQFEGLTDKSLVADSPAWSIAIVADAKGGTLSVEDNGIGMRAAEIEENLGTIARSGTRAFLDALQAQQRQAGAPELIGQFGVGFYSAFMAADEVRVESLRRGPGEKPVRWTSRGDGTYSMAEGSRDRPGTRVELHLREECRDFLDAGWVREIVKRYSDFIPYPVRWADGGREPDSAAAPLNTMRALWRRPRAEVKDEDHAEFYRHLTHDFEAPLRSLHVAAEGQMEFRALLYVPRRASFDLFLPGRRRGLHLYVRNVFIGADFEALLPEYLRFVRGVVDSSDLPLNVSREMLQDDAIIRKIRSNLAGRVLAALAEMREKQPDDYQVFYRAFGRVLKEGFHFDPDQAPRLRELVQFPHDAGGGDASIGLKAYREAMPSSQTEIYYLLADSLEAARHSPHVEAFRQRKLDVLYFVDAIDAWVVDELDEYGGCKLRAIDRGEIDLGSADEQSAAREARTEAGKAFRPLLDLLRARLTADVKDVRLGSRLTDSAACLVQEADEPGPGMIRMLRAMGQEPPRTPRTLEVNAAHPLLARLKALFDTDRDDPRLAEFADLLYDQALVAEGAPPRDPRRFVQSVARLMTLA